MEQNNLAANAASWALSKVGCPYSQEKRTQERMFDCSSLVARAYTAQGKKWKYGGSVPCSYQEIYDDEFELLWPASYEDIGKSMAGKNVIALANQAGDLQFLCTDTGTSRTNKITHVAMVVSEKKIVHARGKAYGVCTNAINLYSGKVCGIARYNPTCSLRKGMKGYRTLDVQRFLNQHGASLTENGEYQTSTVAAVAAYQKENGLKETGIADIRTLTAMGLLSGSEEAASSKISSDNPLARVVGNMVNIRSGPGTNYSVVSTVQKGELLESAQTSGWQPIHYNGRLCWISTKYIEHIQSGKEEV